MVHKWLANCASIAVSATSEEVYAVLERDILGLTSHTEIRDEVKKTVAKLSRKPFPEARTWQDVAFQKLDHASHELIVVEYFSSEKTTVVAWWQGHIVVHGSSTRAQRSEATSEALKLAVAELDHLFSEQEYLLRLYLQYPDFPKKGILFEDCMPLFADPAALKRLIRLMARYYSDSGVTHIVGLESRGFILGGALALEMGVGFIPVRKAGKLPGKCAKVAYTKEYGVDEFEMQLVESAGGDESSSSKGKAEDQTPRVLIVDDLIATGGSLLAGVDLVKEVGFHLVDSCVLRSVPGLVPEGYPAPYTVLLESEPKRNE